MTLLTPEYRQIELYSKKKVLPVAEDAETELAEGTAEVIRLTGTFQTLDAILGEAPAGDDPNDTWAKYLKLPKRHPMEKLAAEIYRALRPFHAGATHASGRIAIHNGMVKASSTIGHTALCIRMTRAGMVLLDSTVAYLLAAADSPYPEAYEVAMLTRYWGDCYDEIRWYYDEDRALFQFRDPLRMNRHYRFDCDNPKHELRGGKVVFEVGEIYRDIVRYPIDFYLHIDEVLYIVPVEALTDYTLPESDLPRWRARLPDGQTLPARWRPRFTREEMIPGLPMT